MLYHPVCCSCTFKQLGNQLANPQNLGHKFLAVIKCDGGGMVALRTAGNLATLSTCIHSWDQTIWTVPHNSISWWIYCWVSTILGWKGVRFDQYIWFKWKSKNLHSYLILSYIAVKVISVTALLESIDLLVLLLQIHGLPALNQWIGVSSLCI